jgi:hypothetical protein
MDIFIRSSVDALSLAVQAQGLRVEFATAQVNKAGPPRAVRLREIIPAFVK